MPRTYVGDFCLGLLYLGATGVMSLWGACVDGVRACRRRHRRHLPLAMWDADDEDAEAAVDLDGSDSQAAESDVLPPETVSRGPGVLVV